MGEEVVACLDIVYALDNLAINRRETIAHAINTLGRMEGNRLLPKLELGALAVQASLCSKAQRLPEGIELTMLLTDSHLYHALQTQVQFAQTVGLRLHSGNEPLSRRRRRLDRGMHHHIHHTHIARMAYTRDNRQGEIGTMERQAIVIKIPEIGRRTATADNNHQIVQVSCGSNLL